MNATDPQLQEALLLLLMRELHKALFLRQRALQRCAAVYPLRQSPERPRRLVIRRATEK